VPINHRSRSWQGVDLCRAFDAIDSVLATLRLARDLPRFFRGRPSHGQLVQTVEWRLRNRSARWLALIERGVYGFPRSPYLPLLRAAGIELGDVARLLDQHGLDATLGLLADRGVYVGYEEFKGRVPIRRGSLELAPDESDFDNPLVKAHFEVRSGGTRSAGTSVKTSLQFINDLLPDTALAFRAHGLDDADHAVWLTAPFLPLLLYARLGHPPRGWFYPLAPLPWQVQLGGRFLQVCTRLLGRPLPGPVWADLREPGRMADWLSAQLGAGRTLTLTSYASSAVRIALAARERGQSLAGVTFITLGEPFTPAKLQAVEAVGARALVRYAFTEAGILGYRCATPQGSDDLHVFTDSFGLVQRTAPVGDSAINVDGFLWTSLLDSAPKLLLNVDSGDHGQLEKRECGCALGRAGLRWHVSDIRSHEKLSGEGMTFVKTNLLRALEEVLPARFGGTSADYQVLEEEGAGGILRVVLVVDPGVVAVEEEAVRAAFLETLSEDGALERYMTRIWQRADTIQIRRHPPVATAAGKILPFHLTRGLDRDQRGALSS
jgi:hypothetical protein